ncbi:MAG: imidazole glycerol phosphate synthase subunit HisF [Sinobacteraceae bacterium]|nr:imidazole glycerol phosphate synthase subunit HisF [Nevskiaceae bacterium]
MLTRRIIACLDVRAGRVVKGLRFRDHRDAGDIVELALRYRDEGVDELVFYDITASPEGRSVERGWVARVARAIDIPFCVAGGLRSVDTARRILQAGADKVSINSPGLERPDLINELAEALGSQCVVVGVDSRRDADGMWRLRRYSGDPDKMQSTGRATLDWVREVQQRGAGEVVINAMDSDGAKNGYDIEQLAAVREVCNVPLIASGGAGNAAHFREVFLLADVDGALAAGAFHSGALRIPYVKTKLAEAGVPVRLPQSLEERA